MRAERPGLVLDASALLAFLDLEAGASMVASGLATGCWMSAVNYAEVLSRVAERGGDPEARDRDWVDAGLIGQLIGVVPFGEEDGVAAAALRPLTRRLGLSLGDRACLALGRRLGLPVLTADRAWAGIDAGVEIVLIRD